MARDCAPQTNDVTIAFSQSASRYQLALLNRIEQAWLLWAAGPETEVLISELRGHAAARRAIEEADLYQVWFDDFFDRVFLFLNRRRQSTDAHRPAFKLFDNRQQQLTIHFVQTVSIHFHSIERIVCDIERDP